MNKMNVHERVEVENKNNDFLSIPNYPVNY